MLKEYEDVIREACVKGKMTFAPVPSTAASLSMDLLTPLNYMVKNGYLPTDSTIKQCLSSLPGIPKT